MTFGRAFATWSDLRLGSSNSMIASAAKAGPAVWA